MGVLLADVHGFGQLVPVAPLEAVDHPGGDVDRPEQQCQRAGEILAMPSLRLTRKSSTGSSLRSIDVHLQRVAELAGVAEEEFQGVGAGA